MPNDSIERPLLASSPLSPTKQALQKIRELKQKLAAAEAASGEPIAIVSMACRFPRRASSPEEFWAQLVAGADEIGEVPPDRWDIDAYFNTDPEVQGRMYARNGAFLEHIDEMDADFFGISPREATWVDPQQRLLLEVGWEALERAGWPADVVGRHTGVFVGWMHNDYQNECSDSLLNLNPYIATGSAGSFLCGRLSYQLGLQGPSLAVDTACSSSLVALHLACQSLYRRECDRALAGGVNVMASPKTTVLTCKLKALSPGGHSRAFDARADGYVRGEGCGMVALRRLSDAQQDGDPILAVIRGTAMTHNGYNSGLTAPSPEAQERVIRQSLRRAGIEPRQVDYLEAHGTGTELGDPIEMRAAAAVLGEGRNAANPLLVGSVKTNIGHLEAAAGVAGLIKTVLALQHGCIPPHLHFEQPNPHIPWDQLPVKIVDRLTDWPARDVRVAGVSAFGMSGTNAHVVLESPPPIASSRNVDVPIAVAMKVNGQAVRNSPRLLVLSGKTAEAVPLMAGRLRDWWQQNPGASLEDVCFTAGAGRRHFERRAAIVVDSIDDAQSQLRQLQRGASAADIYLGAARAQPKIVWQFTGQGSQYVGMARQLYQTQTAFRATLDRCGHLMSGWREQSLLEVMFHDEALLNQTTWTQPALFALEVGLAELLQSWGMQPDVVLGHSVGQFAAACVAGMLSLEDGLWLITERSRLTGNLPSGGAMAAVFAKEAAVHEVLIAYPLLSIAANNGSHNVISGPEASLSAALAEFDEGRVQHKRLSTSHAFHSAMMEPAVEEWRSIVSSVEFRPAQIPVVCNVTGKLLDADFVLNAEYWAQHLRQAVQFAESIKTVSDLGCEVVVELGPQPILNGMAASCWPGSRPTLIPTLQKEQSDDASMFAALAQLYVQGASPDFAALATKRAKKIQLPTYPFQRKRYWGAATPQASQVERGSSHVLLGQRQQLAGIKDETRYESHLSIENPKWLNDHQVFGDVVFPGAAYVEMGLSAAEGTVVLQDIAFEMPMRLTQPTRVQTVVKSVAKGLWEVEIYSSPDQIVHWTRNFSGTIASSAPAEVEAIDLQQIKQTCGESVSVTDFYDSVRNLGLQYGPQFQTIREIHCGQGAVLVRLEADGDVLGYVIPPMVMDGAFQSLAVGLLQDADSAFYLPVGMERLECFSPVSGEVYSLAQWRDSEGDVRNADLTLFKPDGTVLARIQKLRLRPVRRAALRQLAGAGPERLIYSLRWQSATLNAGNEESSNWLIIGRESSQPKGLVRAMSKRGQRCIDVQIRNDTSSQPRELAPDIAGDGCTIFGDDPQQWTSVLQHFFPSKGDIRLDGIVWLAGTVDGAEGLDLIAHTKLVSTGILSLLQALRRERIDQLARGFQIVTRDAIATDESASVSPDTCQFWGLGRVLSAEYPGLRCRLIDVDDFEENETGTVDFLLQDSLENQYVRRLGQWMVPRLVAAKALSHERFSADVDGSYLITGGLGMLGRQAAKWLAGRSAKEIVLVSRKPPTASTYALIAEIEQHGSRIHVIQADISDRDQVSALFDRIQQELPPLKGVIHASGVLDDGLMADQNWSRFEAVLAPKQTGALLLHEMTAGMELDFFILYSSAASVLGSPGQANYATANAFLDGLAQHRRAAGLPALSINWGPWNEGMAASPTVVRSLALQGLTPLTSDEAHQVMEQLISAGAVQATVLDADWRRMRQRLSAFALPVLDLVAPEIPKGSGGDSQLVATLRAATVDARSQLMITHVQSELKQILSLAEPPELDAPLGELGLDSLMAVELSTRLQQQLEPEITVSPTIAFDYPSPRALTQHLLTLFKELPEVVEPVSVARVTERDDVAIIGLGCQFPGAANAVQFWGNLLQGVDSIRELPDDRWDLDQYYSPERTPGKMVSREGGFLDRIGDFDAEFFGISPQEACWMDPQHRLLIEVSWAALEDAGIVPNQTQESNVGVFMGIMSQDYAQLKVDDEAGTIAAFQGAGLSPSAGVGRLSYMFGFEGPSLAIDSASSSSLVAVCQAAKSLLDNECNMALAGGVNAILTPTNSLLLSNAGMLSPDGRCKSFSATADGFGRGEGCGVVVLKRKRDAQRDGDRILAVIRGSAISHNGTTSSLTAPSGRSQERVIRRALENANITAADVDYFEAHGTGTELGDTIEMGAAAAVLGQGHTAEKPLLVGSVKANIGHLEAAAGISGLIKVVLSMQHGTIPPQLHFEQPSPQIPWERLPVKMVTEATSWPKEKTRTACVHALGMSGTNAHCVLEFVEATSTAAEHKNPQRSHHLLTLSAKSPTSLARIAQQYADWFQHGSDEQLADACYTARVGRKHWDHRAAIVADSAADVVSQLRVLEQEACRMPATVARPARAPKMAWIYTRDESHVFATGHTLYKTQPEFRETVDQFSQQFLDQELWPGREETLLDAMLLDRTLAADPRWRGPVLFALHAALTRLWKSWGLEPDVALGEGVGQYSAACVAGVMSWQEALKLVAERSRLCYALHDKQLQRSSLDAQSPAPPNPAVIATAAPSEALEAFEQLADSFDYFPARVPLICSLSGDLVPVHRVLGGSYWRRHLTEPSHLDACLACLAIQDCDIVLEVGPPSSLGPLIDNRSAEGVPTVVASLDHGRDETESMLHVLGQVYVAGYSPNFVEFDRPWPRKKIELPTYPFDRRRYWITDVCQYQQKSTSDNKGT